MVDMKLCLASSFKRRSSMDSVINGNINGINTFVTLGGNANVTYSSSFLMMSSKTYHWPQFFF